MNGDAEKKCPFCKETISAEAVKCRYCKSMLVEKPAAPETLCRDLPGRMLAGVASYLARTLGISVSATRLGFVLLAFFLPPVGVGLYLAAWALTPFRQGEPIPAEKIVESIRRIITDFTSRRAPQQPATAVVHPAPPAPHDAN